MKRLVSGLVVFGALAPLYKASAGVETTPKAPPGVSRALIVAGLPGNREHETLFAAVVKDWKDWLTDSLGFAPSEVRILFGKNGQQGLANGPATREAIEHAVAAIQQVLKPEDRLWVFFLGHGNYDGEHAYLHIAGRDVPAEEMSKLFARLHCKEQVFWLTNSASGWMLPSFSAKGRIIISATLADDESNETEFPYALATVLKRPVAELDTNKDGKVSLLELYGHTVAEVNARFAKDKRAPTEHAQLDDNGDGTGTEQPSSEKSKGNKKSVPDGATAAITYLPLKR
jgi:hypothetical protein